MRRHALSFWTLCAVMYAPLTDAVTVIREAKRSRRLSHTTGRAPLVGTPKASSCAIRHEQCAWSRKSGSCGPDTSCVPQACGILTCRCRPTPIVAIAPWDLLGMNFSEALNRAEVARAFTRRADAFHPAKNGACLELANVEFMAARQARDTLFSLSALAARRADGSTFAIFEKKSGEGPPDTPADAGLGSQTPLLVALYRLLKGWLRKASGLSSPSGADVSWTSWLMGITASSYRNLADMMTSQPLLAILVLALQAVSIGTVVA